MLSTHQKSKKIDRQPRLPSVQPNANHDKNKTPALGCLILVAEYDISTVFCIQHQGIYREILPFLSQKPILRHAQVAYSPLPVKNSLNKQQGIYLKSAIFLLIF